jgi:glycosyltransferase involved in cell wall biosynthesis
MGGGENLMTVFVEFLEESFPHAKIDILTHEQEHPDLEEIADRFNVKFQNTRILRVPTSERNHLRLVQPLRRFFSERDLARVSKGYDLFVNNTIFSLAPSMARHGIYMCMFPLDPVPWQLRDRPLGKVVFRPYTELRRLLYRRWIRSYTVVLAISEFTRTWIRKLWGVDSRVLYPPVDTLENLSLDGKRKSILSIGRFFPGSHNKKHDVLIDTFKALNQNGFGEWKLHLVGGRTVVPGTEEYIRDLRARAEGFPISFHVDARPETLNSLMREATLYWHATGFGENQLEDPYKLEHFGISTIEAMSHGCVPLVFACGGQKEVVQHGDSGFLWSEKRELVKTSSNLLLDSDWLNEMAWKAHRRSHDFNREAFRMRARRLLTDARLIPNNPESHDGSHWSSSP